MQYLSNAWQSQMAHSHTFIRISKRFGPAGIVKLESLVLEYGFHRMLLLTRHVDLQTMCAFENDGSASLYRI